MFSPFYNFIISGSECICFSQSSYQRFFRDKGTSKISIFEAIILKQNQRSVIKEIYIFVLILECSCPGQLQTFWK